MNQDRNNCLQGWKPDVLLAYLEGELPEDTVRHLEAHLEGCSVCSRSLSDLRQMDDILKKSSEAFHPASEQLWRFSAQGFDPEGMVSRHLEECSRCQEDAELLREMTAIGSAFPDKPPVMPASLRARLEGLYPREISPEPPVGLIQLALDQVRAAFRVPVLAMGTAAAVVIAIVLSIPVWRGQIEVPIMAEKPPMKQVAPPAVGFTEPKPGPDQAGRQEVALPSREAPPPKGADQRKLLRERRYAEPSRVPSVEGEEREEKKSEAVEKVKHKDSLGPSPAPDRVIERARRRDPAAKPAVPATPDQRAYLQAVPSGTIPAASSQIKLEYPISVQVRIVDTAGQDVSWLKFTPPVGASRYRFLDMDKKGVAQPAVESSTPLEEGTRLPDKDQPVAHYVVIVEVRPSENDSYDIRASLVDRGGTETGSISESRVAKDVLSDKINHAVWGLLGIR